MSQNINKFINISNQEQLFMIQNNMTSFDIDPFNLLDAKPLSLETLLKKYSILRIKNHPDKGGNSKYFIQITNTLKNIKFIFENLNIDRQYSNLRENFYNSINNENNNKIISDFFNNKGDFDIKVFNKLFDEHKFIDDSNDGYGDMMINEDIKSPKKIDFKDFMKKFKDKNKNNKIIEYKTPEAYNFNNYSLLGEKKNFTNHTLTDYMEAFDENNLLNENNIKINQRTFEDIKNERAINIDDISIMNNEEKTEFEYYNKMNIKKEYNRKKNIDSYDNRLKEYNQKINKILLQKKNT